MTTEGATNRGRGGKSDEPDSEEIPECESSFESLSVGYLDTFCETLFRSAGACLFRDWFLMIDIPASDLILLGWSVLSIYPTVVEIVLMGGVVGRLRKEKPPMGQKYKKDPRL